jgi:hypothetical protein
MPRHRLSRSWHITAQPPSVITQVCPTLPSVIGCVQVPVRVSPPSWPCLGHLELPVAHCLPVQFRDFRSSSLVYCHIDKGKSSRPPRVVVGSHSYFEHLTVLREELPQPVIGNLVTYVSDVCRLDRISSLSVPRETPRGALAPRSLDRIGDHASPGHPSGGRIQARTLSPTFLMKEPDLEHESSCGSQIPTAL